MVLFGQLIVGPPGAGKTTYCQGIQMFLQGLGRKCEIINLDFANERTPYTACIDVRDFISLERMMEEFNLGPNGGMISCMEYLLNHLDWLEDKISNLDPFSYLLIDMPGQVELFTHFNYVEKIIHFLQKQNDCRFTSVHLVDSFYCSNPSIFISSVLLIASTMLRLNLPHVNVLTKIDLLPQYGKLPFNFDFFTEMYDLQPLVHLIDTDIFSAQNNKTEPNSAEITDDNFSIEDIEREGSSPAAIQIKAPLTKYEKYTQSRKKMISGLCEVLNDFGLVSFLPLNISDGDTVARVINAIDNANGYNFAAIISEQHQNSPEKEAESKIMNSLFKYSMSNLESTYSKSIEIYERSVDMLEDLKEAKSNL